MASVMSVMPWTTPLPQSDIAVADRPENGFEDALRTERAALDRAEEPPAGRETIARRDIPGHGEEDRGIQAGDEGRGRQEAPPDHPLETEEPGRQATAPMKDVQPVSGPGFPAEIAAAIALDGAGGPVVEADGATAPESAGQPAKEEAAGLADQGELLQMLAFDFNQVLPLNGPPSPVQQASIGAEGQDSVTSAVASRVEAAAGEQLALAVVFPDMKSAPAELEAGAVASNIPAGPQPLDGAELPPVLEKAPVGGAMSMKQAYDAALMPETYAAETPIATPVASGPESPEDKVARTGKGQASLGPGPVAPEAAPRSVQQAEIQGDGPSGFGHRRSGVRELHAAMVGNSSPAVNEAGPDRISAPEQAVSGRVEAPRPIDGARVEFPVMMTQAGGPGAVPAARAYERSQAQPAILPPIPDARIVDQIVSRVSLSRSGSDTTLSMTLHPRELGEVRVELVSAKEGMKAHLHTQTQMVQEALERHLPRLREAFEAQGVKLGEVQVSCDDRRDGGSAAFQGRDQGQAASFQYVLGESAPVESGAGSGWSVEAVPSGWTAGHGFSLRV